MHQRPSLSEKAPRPPAPCTQEDAFMHGKRKESHKTSGDGLRPEVFVCVREGDEQVEFPVPAELISASGLLSRRARESTETPPYVDLSDLRDKIPAAIFYKIEQYLLNGEYVPTLFEQPGKEPRLDGAPWHGEGKKREVERSARLYEAAAELEMEGLQTLIRRKLAVLRPFSPICLLICARAYQSSHKWGCSAEDEMRGLLMDHMVASYWALTEDVGIGLARLLQDDRDLMEEVLSKVVVAGRK